MKGFDRNIRYSLMWVKKISIYTYAVALLFELWFWFLGTVNVNSVQEFFINYIRYAVFVGALLILLFTAVNMVTVFNQMVSYGCTRKCAAWGMICTNVLTVLCQLVINALVYLVFHIIFGGGLLSAGMIMMLINLYLIMTALSPLAGVAVYLWGKVGYFILVCGTSALMGGCMGFLIGGIQDGDALVMSLFNDGLADVTINAIVMPVAVAAIVLTGFLLVKITARAEVKG